MIIALCILHNKVSAQGTQIHYGQNRVQFHDFEWSSYESENFTTYYYPGGQNIAKFVVMAAEDRVLKFEEDFNFHINTKIEILIYSDITDLGQTNIGLGNESYNLGGENKIIGNKLFLYFDGNHQNLYRNMNQGLARLFVGAMMSGSTIQEILQNTIFGSMPAWFSEGLIKYTAEDWNTNLDSKLRDYFKHTKKINFAKWSNLEPAFAGQSMWNYIEEEYGEDAIKNILYLSRINKNAFNGIGFVLGVSEDDLESNWIEYYKNRYELDNADRQPTDSLASIRIKTRKKREVTQLKLTPDGNYLAYASHDGGGFKVYIRNMETGKKKKVQKGGFKSDNYPYDNSYPLLAWSPGGHTLAIAYEKRDEITLVRYELDTKDKTKDHIENFQRLNSIAYSKGDQELVLSAQQMGQSDIYLYSLSNARTTRITNDFYDDLDAAYIRSNDREGIMFSSNRLNDTIREERLDTILPINTFDLYFYNLQTRPNVLAKITNTPLANEKAPIPYKYNQFAFLSDENGIYNQYAGEIDSVFARKDTLLINDNGEIMDKDAFIEDSSRYGKISVDVYNDVGRYKAATDYSLNIEEHTYASLANKNLKTERYLNKQRFIVAPSNSPQSTLRPTQYFVQETSRLETKKVNTILEESQELDISSSDKTGLDSLFMEKTEYNFVTEYNIILTPEGTATVGDGFTNLNNNAKPSPVALNARLFNPALAVPYRAKFTTNYMSTQLDNSLMMPTYENFSLNGPVFNYPDLSGMITLGITDVMEDHKIIGGFRIPTDFNGTEVFVSYENLKKRIDKKILFYRKSDQVSFLKPISSNFYDVVLGKLKTNYMEVGLSYPFDVTKSLRLVTSFRNDKRLIAYTDQYTLGQEDDVKENWGGARLEFVHDQSKEIQMNIMDGFRYKFFIEYFRNINEKKANLYNFGYDIRHYLVLYKNIIWANRLAGASSFGQRKIIYYLGGVDSWINQDFDYSIPIPADQNYAFQASATNLRGFPQNVRNGNSYIVLNSEIRFPVFSFLAKKPLKSPFLNNFQLVGFCDIGAAYKGLTPFDEQNPFSSEVVSPTGNPVEVTVNYFRNPTVFGYGAGVRSTLLGYFIRADAGWGHDGQSVTSRKPSWYISLSKDF